DVDVVGQRSYIDAARAVAEWLMVNVDADRVAGDLVAERDPHPDPAPPVAADQIVADRRRAEEALIHHDAAAIRRRLRSGWIDAEEVVMDRPRVREARATRGGTLRSVQRHRGVLEIADRDAGELRGARL